MTEEERIKKMKDSCLGIIKIQGANLTDDYMAGMYNGMISIYNTLFPNNMKSYCHKNSSGKWEVDE